VYSSYFLGGKSHGQDPGQMNNNIDQDNKSTPCN